MTDDELRLLQLTLPTAEIIRVYANNLPAPLWAVATRFQDSTPLLAVLESRLPELLRAQSRSYLYADDDKLLRRRELRYLDAAVDLVEDSLAARLGLPVNKAYRPSLGHLLNYVHGGMHIYNAFSNVVRTEKEVAKTLMAAHGRVAYLEWSGFVLQCADAIGQDHSGSCRADAQAIAAGEILDQWLKL